MTKMEDKVDFDALMEIVATRAKAGADQSYTAKLMAAGIGKIAKKLGEEGVETALAAVSEDDAALIGEAGDLLYHLAVLLTARGIDTNTIWRELARRTGQSGLAEKAARLDQ